MQEKIIREFATTMQNDKLRKDFGSRLKQLRKQQEWTQKELAGKLGIRFGQLNKYECGLNAPPIEVLLKMADLFHTSIDYMLTGDRTDDMPLHNKRLLERFKALEEFEPDDQETVIKLIDAMIVKRRVEGVLEVG